MLSHNHHNAIEEEIVQADKVREHIYTALSRLELALRPIPFPAVCTENPLDSPVAKPLVKTIDTTATNETASM